MYLSIWKIQKIQLHVYLYLYLRCIAKVSSPTLPYSLICDYYSRWCSCAHSAWAATERILQRAAANRATPCRTLGRATASPTEVPTVSPTTSSAAISLKQSGSCSSSTVWWVHIPTAQNNEGDVAKFWQMAGCCFFPPFRQTIAWNSNFSDT